LPRNPLRARFCAAALLASALSCGRSTVPPAPTPPTGTAAGITPADARARLELYADDSMQGRKAGTPGNVKATAYLAAEAGRLGLAPAGDGGTFFQTVPLVERRLAPDAALAVEGQAFRPGADFIPRDQGRGSRSFDGAEAVYGGTLGDSTRPALTLEQAAGKLVVVTVAPGPGGRPGGVVNRATTTDWFSTAAAIAVATLDAVSPADRASLAEQGAQLASGDSPPAPAFLYVTTRVADALLGKPLPEAAPGDAGRTVHGSVRFLDAPAAAPARNVVALLLGRDPALRGQIVAIGAHNDHIGLAPTPEDHDSLRAFNRVMRPMGAENNPGTPTAAESARIAALRDSLRQVDRPRFDSVFNGADDDGSGSVALLEIAEALARSPGRPKRSILFVWHTAEELGLLGSDYFTRHPTVPRDSIVAQLNMDMIGRGDSADIAGGGPQYLQLVGSRRLSTELGDLVERVNAEGRHGFTFDYSWDANGHPANIYCRSDHYMYARFGIPVTFFTTGEHLDYHQLTDEAEYIDYDKLARVAGLVQDVARHVADLDHRPVVDKPRPDPEGKCKQ
jgi:hypothetical protein